MLYTESRGPPHKLPCFPAAGISIQEQLDARTAVRRYRVVARIHPMESYPAEAGLTFPMIEAAFQNSFVPRLRVRCCMSCASLLSSTLAL
jgi:hypothetical protein